MEPRATRCPFLSRACTATACPGMSTVLLTRPQPACSTHCHPTWLLRATPPGCFGPVAPTTVEM
eukprot:1780473-Alexandrium_andersonii.AAC.1